MKQAKLLRHAKAVLGLTDAELAAKLGVSSKTMQSYQADEDAAHYRNMPAMAKKLLALLVKGKRG